MTDQPIFRFANLTTMQLLIGYCPNEHLHIFGFGGQLHGDLDETAMTYTTKATCKDCGCEVKRVDKVERIPNHGMDGEGI